VFVGFGGVSELYSEGVSYILRRPGGPRAVLGGAVRSVEGVVRCCTEVLRCLMVDGVRVVRGGARGVLRVLVLAVSERKRAPSGW